MDSRSGWVAILACATMYLRWRNSTAAWQRRAGNWFGVLALAALIFGLVSLLFP